MIRAKSCTLVAVASLALASIALPAAAQSRDLSPLNVTSKAPTSVRVSVAGKDFATVRHDVRVAAHTVCRNAVFNDDLSAFDLNWCSEATAWKAMSRYSAMVRQYGLASVGDIVLAAR